jgi:hypothetical protein
MIAAFRDANRALALLALTWLGAGDAMAEDQKFATPVGTIVIDVDSQWRPAEMTAEGMSGIAFEVGSGGRTMNLLLGTVDGLDERFDAAQVRKLVEELRKSEDTGGKSTTEVTDYTGRATNGSYFQVTGAPGIAPKEGEYRWMITGMVATDNAPLIFTIAWNEGGKAVADRAFASIKGLRFASR